MHMQHGLRLPSGADIARRIMKAPTRSTSGARMCGLSTSLHLLIMRSPLIGTMAQSSMVDLILAAALLWFEPSSNLNSFP